MKIPESMNRVTRWSKALAWLIILTSPVAGFLLGRFYEQSRQPMTYKVTVNQTDSSKRTASPTAIIDQSNFQRILRENCLAGEIRSSALPIRLVENNNKQIFFTKLPEKMMCWYNRETGNGYVFYPISGAFEDIDSSDIFIYDAYSKEEGDIPEYLFLCDTCTYPSKYKINIGNGIEIIPEIIPSDGPMLIKDIDLDFTSFKTINTPAGKVYAQFTVRKIVPNNRKLSNLLKKFSNPGENPDYPGEYLDRNKINEINQEIVRLLKLNINNLGNVNSYAYGDLVGMVGQFEAK